MKFVYKDLLNLLSEKPTKNHLSEKLFQLGHEHELMEKFSILTLRLIEVIVFHYGLARDLNIFLVMPNR